MAVIIHHQSKTPQIDESRPLGISHGSNTLAGPVRCNPNGYSAQGYVK